MDAQNQFKSYLDDPHDLEPFHRMTMVHLARCAQVHLSPKFKSTTTQWRVDRAGGLYPRLLDHQAANLQQIFGRDIAPHEYRPANYDDPNWSNLLRHLACARRYQVMDDIRLWVSERGELAAVGIIATFEKPWARAYYLLARWAPDGELTDIDALMAAPPDEPTPRKLTVVPPLADETAQPAAHQAPADNSKPADSSPAGRDAMSGREVLLLLGACVAVMVAFFAVVSLLSAIMDEGLAAAAIALTFPLVAFGILLGHRRKEVKGGIIGGIIGALLATTLVGGLLSLVDSNETYTYRTCAVSQHNNRWELTGPDGTLVLGSGIYDGKPVTTITPGFAASLNHKRLRAQVHMGLKSSSKPADFRKATTLGPITCTWSNGTWN